jgi:hypothetical protein
MNASHRTAADHAPAEAARHGPTSFAGARDAARRHRQQRARDLQHDDQRFDAFRTLRARRALVVLCYLALFAAAALSWTDLPGLAGVAAHVVFLFGIGVAFLLRRALRQTDDAPDEALDERLVAIRNAAHRSAYYAVVWATLAVLLGLLLAAGTEFTVAGPHLQLPSTPSRSARFSPRWPSWAGSSRRSDRLSRTRREFTSCIGAVARRRLRELRDAPAVRRQIRVTGGGRPGLGHPGDG